MQNHTFIHPSHPNIRYFGRWNQEEGCCHSYWGGAYFKVNFTGGILKLEFSGNCDIVVHVDGGSDRTYRGAKGTVDVSSLIDRTRTLHTLLVNSRFDCQEMEFVGLVLAADGRTAMPQTTPILEFIGDSITSGDCTENGACDSYAWLTASGLGYEHTQISFCGIAVTPGYGYLEGLGNPSPITQYSCLQPPNYQTDALRGQLTAWDFSRYTPKAVIINIGTNDCNSGADAPTFQCSYRRLLELVREKNPAAPIFALIPFGGYFREEITQVVHRFGETQGNIYLVDTRGWLEPPDYADGIHPTNEGQSKAAQKLCQVLSPILGPGTP